MQKLNRHQLDAYISESEILLGSHERPGLMLTPSDEIVKFFYRRKLISSRTLIPQAVRFAANSRKLCAKSISAPLVKNIIHCPELPVHMVVYDRIEGSDFRELCAGMGNEQVGIIPAFIAELHAQGVFFRAIHLGNLLFDGNRIHLVDISDLQVRKRPLNVHQRARNLAHLFNSELDKSLFLEYGIARFVAEYEAALHFNALQSRLFRLFLGRSMPDRDLPE